MGQGQTSQAAKGSMWQGGEVATMDGEMVTEETREKKETDTEHRVKHGNLQLGQ